MDHPFPYPLWTQLLLELAPQEGIQVEILEPRAGYLARLTKNGKTRLFLADTNPLNSHLSCRISRDKAYTKVVLERENLPIPQGEIFFFPNAFSRIPYHQGKSIKEALEYAKNLGFPLILKPNTSSMGKFVSLIESEKELKEKIQAMQEGLPGEKAFLLEEWIHGQELRILLLDDKPLLALEKRPFEILGTGKDTILELALKKWQSLRLEEDGDRIQNWKIWAEKAGYTLESILPINQKLILEPIKLNLHQGAQGLELKEIPPAVLRVAQKALQVLGLRYGGVDLKWDGNQVRAILEVNSNAGFLLFGKTSAQTMKKAKEMARFILKLLFEEEGRP